uniref:Uncharacterized protein n=1 Tax=Octopus bimaculoides TaxID=37653 RepID=A0A0L8G3B8_OCTBM
MSPTALYRFQLPELQAILECHINEFFINITMLCTYSDIVLILSLSVELLMYTTQRHTI